MEKKLYLTCLSSNGLNDSKGGEGCEVHPRSKRGHHMLEIQKQFQKSTNY
jgi:hypothetical protein